VSFRCRLVLVAALALCLCASAACSHAPELPLEQPRGAHAHRAQDGGDNADGTHIAAAVATGACRGWCRIGGDASQHLRSSGHPERREPLHYRRLQFACTRDADSSQYRRPRNASGWSRAGCDRLQRSTWQRRVQSRVSQNRARTVQRYLVSHGVPPDRIVIVVRGEALPRQRP
jgi:hypothetical protein